MSHITAFLASALATILLDQVSKMLVMRGLEEARFYAVIGSSGLRRQMNTRAGLIPLSRSAAGIVWTSSVAGVGLAVAIAPWLPMMAAFALGLVIGGASSNLGDRVVRGAVVDFIAVLRWTTFNLADIAMVVGTPMAIWNLP